MLSRKVTVTSTFHAGNEPESSVNFKSNQVSVAMSYLVYAEYVIQKFHGRENYQWSEPKPI